jgi:hypothetical protein
MPNEEIHCISNCKKHYNLTSNSEFLNDQWTISCKFKLRKLANS